MVARIVAEVVRLTHSDCKNPATLRCHSRVIRTRRDSKLHRGSNPGRPSPCSCARATSSRPARRRRATAQPAPRERCRPSMRASPNPRANAQAVPPTWRRDPHPEWPREGGLFAANEAESRQRGDLRPHAHANHARSGSASSLKAWRWCRRALRDNRTRRPGLGQPSCFVEVGRGSARRA
jgi:hypothetical protein